MQFENKNGIIYRVTFFQYMLFKLRRVIIVVNEK